MRNLSRHSGLFDIKQWVAGSCCAASFSFATSTFVRREVRLVGLGDKARRLLRAHEMLQFGRVLSSEMTLRLAEGIPSTDGIQYPFESLGVRGAVHIAMSNDGMSWRVWFTVAGVTHGQHGRDPLVALRKAIEFSLAQRPEWREWLDILSLEEQLNAQGALSPNRTLIVSTASLAEMGLVLKYPEAIRLNVLERTLRGAKYLTRTEGMRSDRWRVTAASWQGAGRELEIAIHRGA